MIGILDKYIIGKFLRTFFFTVLIFSMVSVIVDWSSNVERFISSDITKTEIIFEYFPTFLLFILGLIWPMLTLIAVIFFTGRMAANSEVISILNAGVSFRRFLRPYLLAASFLTFLYALGIHFFVPMANEHRQELERVYFNRNKDEGQTRDIHLFVAPQTKVYINFYRKRDSTARDFRLETYQDHQLVALTKARHAKYKPETDQWELHNYEIRTFNGVQESFLNGIGAKLDTSIQLKPEDFVEYKEQQASMTTPALLQYIAKQKRKGAGNVRRYQVELARRTAEPFTVFILTLIGVSVASRKVRGGMGIQLAAGMFMGALFVFLSRFSATFSAGASIPPLLGMWMPNIIFLFAALYFIRTAQK